jgi:indolepyruvate ferredoxin oxidoreductase beta subunit
MYDRLPINVLIAGVGGQGNLLASRLLARAAMPKGFQATIGETKGASQRSGSVTSHIRFSEAPLGPLIPLKTAHIILGFEPLETLRASRKYSSDRTAVIVNPSPVVPLLVAQGMQQYPTLDSIFSELESINENVYIVEATELARQAGDSIALNVVMLGALCGLRLLPFEREHFVEAIVGRVSEKHRELNRRAFEAGYEQGNRQLAHGRKEGDSA